MATNSKYGRYLAKRRKREGLSLRKLAEKADVGYGMIFAIEHGLTPNPGAESWEKLGRAFGENWVVFPQEVRP